MKSVAQTVRLDGATAFGALFGLSVFVLALAGGGYGSVALSVFAMVAGIVLVGLVLSGAARFERPATPQYLLAAGALLLYALVTALSLGWTPDPDAGFTDVVRLGGYLGVFLVAGLAMGPGSGVAALRGLLVAVVAVAVVACASRLLGLGAGDQALAVDIPPAGGRLSHPVGYWNALGALMALGVPAIVAAVSEARGRRSRGAWLACAVPLLLTLYMTSSRGALLAAIAGTGLMIGVSRERRRLAAAAFALLLVAIPPCVAAELAPGILDSAGDGTVGSAEFGVIAAALGTAALALVGGDALFAAIRGPVTRVPLPGARVLVPLALLAVVAVALAVGPSRIVDDFRSAPTEPRAGALLQASGSGRSQFWGAALRAFEETPERGVGAGGYASYWNENSSLGTATRNAHSEPLEALAELGVVGFAAFVVFGGAIVAGAVARTRARSPGAPVAAGVLVAGSVGFLIDWTWQIPAVTMPVLVLAAALGARGFGGGEGRAAAAPAIGPRAASLAAVAATALAAAAIWSAAVLGVSSHLLEESAEALERGDAAAAATHARSAAATQPWAAAPYVRLAEIEQGVGNLAAAESAMRAALDRSPGDFTYWLFAGQLAVGRGDFDRGAVYIERAAALAPALLGRITEFVPEAR